MATEYKVKQGDCISSIAAKYGHVPDAIWNDPANRQLKEEREDPNVLKPGDVVVIPDKRVKEESGGTEQRHKFRKKGGAHLRIRFVDGGEAIAGLAYTLDVDGVVREGNTDGDGWVDEPLPPAAREGVLYLGEKRLPIPLQFGRLDPITEVTGAQERLRNLGYYTGPIDGDLGPDTVEAVKAFQRASGLTASGDLDSTTQDKLQEAHGG
jgi:hypothetical protein